MVLGLGCCKDGTLERAPIGVGTPWGWDTKGSQGWGHRDGHYGNGYHEDGDTKETTWGWGQRGDGDTVKMGHKGIPGMWE